MQLRSRSDSRTVSKYRQPVSPEKEDQSRPVDLKPSGTGTCTTKLRPRVARTSTRKDGTCAPKNPACLAKAFVPFLEQFSSRPGAPYVHPKVISFRDENHRWSWLDDISDARDRATIAEFYCHNHYKKKSWVGLFSIETENYIGSRDISSR
ncbi:hypothetical protein CDV31_016212 [Fusarium ambrosium]|uniref:Uncharacterized protein n=1 Tax=Fusarium ambrosium TaxID=131363 RepID=A0A428SD19_9HYPO|nr:hypothetical protein CDV31_016212 [Fusarium ambrosium]